jgi:hypothetical protein
MRFAVAVLFVLSMLALAGCESKSEKLDRRIQKADRIMSEFDAAHPDYHDKCYPILHGISYADQYNRNNLSLGGKAAVEAYEAKWKARPAECYPLDEQYDKLQRDQQDARNAK